MFSARKTIVTPRGRKKTQIFAIKMNLCREVMIIFVLEFSTHLKNSNPGKSDVVEWDGALKGIAQVRLAGCVILVPVDAGTVPQQGRVGAWKSWTVARFAVEDKVWDLSAPGHAVVFWFAADEVLVVWTHVRIGELQTEILSDYTGRLVNSLMLLLCVFNLKGVSVQIKHKFPKIIS